MVTDRQSYEPTPFVLEPGARIHQYELIRELGRGGMGVVYAARDERLGRRVAIKFVLDASTALAEQFIIEARATAQCNHDNIVIIHAVDEYEGMPYIVLEYLEGITLRDSMNAVGRLPAARVIELMLPVARALSRAHELEIIHRDLKPENVFVTTSGQVKVLDFGIARALRDEGRDGPLNEKQGWVGTMTYMSPQQMGTEPVDHRADVWAAGIMMFQMLAGRHPVEPPTTENLITAAVSDDPMTPLLSVAPDVQPGLAQVVDACLRKNLDTRPTSAILVKALEALVPARTMRMPTVDEGPYPGLAAFQEADADRFFGRSAEVTRMVARIRDTPLTGVVGPSGAGKSSFVRAGVGPALKAMGERWDVVTLRPGRQPLAALANALHRLTAPVGSDAGTGSGARAEVIRRIRAEPGFLGSQLRAYARRASLRVLVFVDQLEELFTLVPDPDDRAAFTAALAGAADDPSTPVRVVVSMRSDFLDRLAEAPRFVEELSRGLLLMSTPDLAGLREALEQPLALLGYKFESQAIVGEMLDALANAPGALPLLQFAASKLWDGRDRDRKLITTQSYQAIGGISGALAAHADEVLGGMDSGSQRLAQKIFRMLVTPERTRAIVELADLHQLATDRGEVTRVLDQLVAARLLVVQTRGDGGGGTVEIVHESLIDRWPTLRRWLDEDQEDLAFRAQLATAAKQWDTKGRPSGMLWRGSAADEARRWFTARPRELVPRDREYLEAVVALGQRGARVRRRALSGAFALLVVIAAGAIASMVSIGRARDAAENAAAELRAAAAARDDQERQTHEAERAKLAADQRRVSAEVEKAKAEAVVVQKEALVERKETEVSEGKEQLQQKNAELEAALRDQRAATTRAEQAGDAAKRAAADAERAKAELQTLLDRERARVKKLEDERKHLSTQLKE